MNCGYVRWACALLLGFALDPPVLAHAQDALPDRFKIDVGVFFVTEIDTTVSLAPTGAAAGVGALVEFEDAFGLENSENVPRIDGYYRFGKRSRVDFSYWKIDRDATQTIAQDVTIGDTTFNVNETVRTRFDSETFKVAYGFSFHNSPKVEVGINAGLHLTTLDMDVTDLTGGAGSEQADAPVPLPVLGFYLRYNISRRWRFNANTQFFFLEYEDFEGSLTDVRLNVEHQTFKHVGFGLGLNRIDFDIEANSSDDDFRGTFENVNEGLQVYVFAAFGKSKYLR
jgi:hypothetical protein